MGCNCKKTMHNVTKYSDDGILVKDNENIFMKILQFIMQLGFGILVSVIIIVMIIPMLLYIFGCLMFGLSPTIKLYNFNKKKKKNE